MKATHKLALASALLALLSPEVTRAAILEITFDGLVKSVSPEIQSGSLSVNAPVHGRVTVDSSLTEPAPDATPHTSSFRGNAPGPTPVPSFELTIGAYSLVGTLPNDSENWVNVQDNVPSDPLLLDRFIARSRLAGSDVNGFSPYAAQFAVISAQDRIDGDEVPTAAELTSFLGDLFQLNVVAINFLTFGPPGAAPRVEWSITSFTAVPEPSELAFLASVIAVLCAKLRSR